MCETSINMSTCLVHSQTGMLYGHYRPYELVLSLQERNPQFSKNMSQTFNLSLSYRLGGPQSVAIGWGVHSLAGGSTVLQTAKVIKMQQTDQSAGLNLFHGCGDSLKTQF